MAPVAVGRFAPSPSGDLHLGNLRTALVAWLFARSAGSRFLLRIEDLDVATATPEHEAAQLRDLRAIGVDWDGDLVRQSSRRARHDDVIAALTERGLTYPCFCTRREIRDAAAAPHGPLPEGAYPGTCRDLSAAGRSARSAAGRPPALRLRTHGEVVAFDDRIHGRVERTVDDVVLRRGDGTPAYNLAVVVDDADTGVGEVVRGDDLLASTPRQIHLAHLLGFAVPSYAHVPLVLGPDGRRLAKRDGAVTLSDRVALGETPGDVRARLAVSLGLAEPGERPTPADLVARFDVAALPRDPWVLGPADLGAG
jgi:glutamyl-tRNA synthetase